MEAAAAGIAEMVIEVVKGRSSSHVGLDGGGTRDRRCTMSDLVVVGFQGEDTADQVLNKLVALQKEHLIDLEDACVVVRDQNGTVHLKQAVHLAGMGAASGGAWGALWGTLIGLLFLNP